MAKHRVRYTRVTNYKMTNYCSPTKRPTFSMFILKFIYGMQFPGHDKHHEFWWWLLPWKNESGSKWPSVSTKAPSQLLSLSIYLYLCICISMHVLKLKPEPLEHIGLRGTNRPSTTRLYGRPRAKSAWPSSYTLRYTHAPLYVRVPRIHIYQCKMWSLNARER